MAALVVGRWEAIRNHWDNLTRARAAENAAMGVVSNDTEYFCPMDPGVVSSWPSRCGVCNMALVVRRKGDATVLPDGVVARMQLSPYRVRLAGVLTKTVEYRPLVREFEGAGLLRRENGRSLADVDLPRSEAAWTREGTSVEVRCRELAGRAPFSGRVAVVERLSRAEEDVRARVEIDDPKGEIPSGTVVDARFRIPVGELEPFRSEPAGPPRRRAGEPRDVYACADHADSLATSAGRCPLDRKPRTLIPLGDHQRLRWWCPMHPEVTADWAGATCGMCGGMALKPRIVSFRPEGKALAVPESAVVETGARTLVFVESMPGTFDGVEVVLGPRCGTDYPVVQGVEAGQKVVMAGAFLLDAETRLNPGLAAAYFGAARDRAKEKAEPKATSAPVVAEDSAMAGLSPDDRRTAERQRVCPVTNKPLGSMGLPTRVQVGDRLVFLCCEGCEGRLRKDPARYLTKLPKPSSP